MLSIPSSGSDLVLLVSGSRYFSDCEALWSKLSALSPSLLVVGDCPTGADELARSWACCVADPTPRVQFHRALWSVWGRKAGPKRNAEMVNSVAELAALGRSVLCLFCWPPIGVPCRGTVSTFKLAVAAGLPFVELGPRPADLAALQPQEVLS